MKKRIFSRILALAMALSLLSTTAFAAVDLGQYITDHNGDSPLFIDLNPVDGDSNFVMNGDITTNKTLNVGADSNITLNMNGHTLTHENNNGQVFTVSGQLTVDATNGGTITGGNGVDKKGGAVYIWGDGENGGSFSMTGGEISGNKAQHGGAIFAGPGATVNIDGTTIKDNEATKRIGGAIYGVNADVNLKNVTFEGNKATNGAALGFDSTDGYNGSASIENCTFKDNTGSESIVFHKVGNGTGTLTGTVPSGTESVWIDDASGFTATVAENGIATIKDAKTDETIPAIFDTEGRCIQDEKLVSGGNLVLCFRAPTEDDIIPEDPTGNPDDDTAPDTTLPVEGLPAAGTAATTIEDEETPLAGIVTLADLLNALWEYEGIEEVELPEDFKWLDHDYAQAIYWGLDEALVVDTEDDPLDPDELLTVGLMREVLVNFVELYHGLEDFEVVLEGEDEDLVMDLGERLLVFYDELEAALAA